MVTLIAGVLSRGLTIEVEYMHSFSVAQFVDIDNQWK
jgi:hypothetical protein